MVGSGSISGVYGQAMLQIGTQVETSPIFIPQSCCLLHYVIPALCVLLKTPASAVSMIHLMTILNSSAVAANSGSCRCKSVTFMDFSGFVQSPDTHSKLSI